MQCNFLPTVITNHPTTDAKECRQRIVKGGRRWCSELCFIGKHSLYIGKEVVNKFITHSLNKQSMSIIWEVINKAIVNNNHFTGNTLWDSHETCLECYHW